MIVFVRVLLKLKQFQEWKREKKAPGCCFNNVINLADGPAAK